MNVECLRIVDQLYRAFRGDGWHGSPISELLSGVTAEQASTRVLQTGHTIWELVVHIDLYVQAAGNAVRGVPMPRWFGTEQDWPAITDTSANAWKTAHDALFANAERLQQSVERFPDARLQENVPGREYSFYILFHGVVQHSLYHGGQIVMLKKAVA